MLNKQSIERYKQAVRQNAPLYLILGLSLLLSTAGFALSLRFLRVVYSKTPVEIHCDKDDLEKMDRAGETLRQLIKK